MKKFESPIYVVKAGDTINTIAQKNGVNPTQILLTNNIMPNMIKEGVALYIKK